MTNRYVVIHGHFYQPPRENPWLETVEREPSAHPHHDWNQRIAAECYGPNAVARVLGKDRTIVALVDNYARISFDFGPTLLSWLESERPEIYRRILVADRESAARFGGHGSAMAMAYNHPILPLANARDRQTQVAWGIRDFVHRFGRRPEGMWLPETAVSTASLEALAEAGVAFTVLAPHQLKRVRPLSGGAWQTQVDTRRPYRVRLPSGRSIAVFAYDGDLARGAAFGQLLGDSTRFVDHIALGFDRATSTPQLVHLATDGETYGHHHHRGDMALAAALEAIDAAGGMKLTNYAQFLNLHPPTAEAEIAEDTSWSCAHGVERWRSDCGCRIASEPGSSQAWRAPLRRALDRLRDDLAPAWERCAAELIRDPWAARDAYIDVLLDGENTTREGFLAAHQVRPLSATDRVRVFELLELQRAALLMYTSCGWFFDDLSGIETRQVLRYAGRALELATRHLPGDFREAFFAELEQARSFRDPSRGGREIWTREVETAAVDLRRAAASWALGQAAGVSLAIGGHDLSELERDAAEAGSSRLLIGRLQIRHRRTEEAMTFDWAVVHIGEPHLLAGVRPAAETLGRDGAVLAAAFARLDAPALFRTLEERFGPDTYGIRALLADDRERVLAEMGARIEEEADAALLELYERRAGWLRLLVELGLGPPPALRVAAERALERELELELAKVAPDAARAQALAEEARRVGIPLDRNALAHVVQTAFGRDASALGARDAEWRGVLARVRLARRLNLPVDLWEIQNAAWTSLDWPAPAELGELLTELGFAPQVVARAK